MAVSDRFICNVEKPFKLRQKFALVGLLGLFRSKIKIRGTSSRLSEYITQEAVLKGLWWSLYFENHKDVFIYRCIKNSCITFSKKFLNQTKVVNEIISKKY